MPPLSTPVAPASMALAQLRLDLSAHAHYANPQLAALAPSALAAASAATELPRPPVDMNALGRIRLANELVQSFKPEQFAELPADRQEALLGSIWDGWKKAGLVESDAADPLDRLILTGIDDRRLTSRNKSAFLAAVVLGYPLEDSLWLQRTRIEDALEENRLRYPQGQRWISKDGMPQFLGTSKRAQALVDHWGAANEHAKKIVAQVRAGSTALPKSDVIRPEASSAFARIAAELVAAKDEEALALLTGEDPTFVAFLLDAKKPGYYAFNTDHGALGRVLETRAFRALGVRRLEKPDGGAVDRSSYLYRPGRVLDRLEGAATEPAGDWSASEKAVLQEYVKRGDKIPLEPTRWPPTAPFTFP